MAKRYTTTARILHWLVALAVLVQIGLGLAADWTERPLSSAFLDAHVQLGLTILALMALRVLWRISHAPPPLPAVVPRWQRAIARSVHGTLYVLLCLMPVSGYLLWMWIGKDLAFLGVASIPVPDLAGKDEFWRSVAGYTHEYAGYALYGVVVLHIGAAVRHELQGLRLIRDRML